MTQSPYDPAAQQDSGAPQGIDLSAARSHPGHAEAAAGSAAQQATGGPAGQLPPDAVAVPALVFDVDEDQSEIGRAHV